MFECRKEKGKKKKKRKGSPVPFSQPGPPPFPLLLLHGPSRPISVSPSPSTRSSLSSLWQRGPTGQRLLLPLPFLLRHSTSPRDLRRAPSPRARTSMGPPPPYKEQPPTHPNPNPSPCVAPRTSSAAAPFLPPPGHLGLAVVRPLHRAPAP
jgi:hypothetical protein